ncbi:esterase family protein [Rhodococcus rhodnii]|nr:alpha/beta hydrolase family protein [Rhodococcus rhodnii]TXG92921.1 esterase family protein [Rhodococcus rhodnii]
MRWITAAALAAGTALAVAPAATAQPSTGTSSLVRTDERGERQLDITVYSAAMDREIPLRVLTPADTSEPRPTLYLLNGAGGGEDAATWDAQTDVVEFFADKNVNVVTPTAGAFSYYSDWEQDDPVLGRNKWTTFLTQELPPIIDETFGTTGVNSIAGISMAGSSVLSLAQAAPDLYRSVGAYSGCAQTATQPGRMYVDLVVEGRGGADSENMWGPKGGPGWIANDPTANAEKLRGLEIYVSSGTGIPGPYDALSAPGIDGDTDEFTSRMIMGTVIEAAVNQCTHTLAGRLGELGIPATFDFQPIGTHSWPYWQDQLHKSWPILAGPLGV